MYKNSKFTILLPTVIACSLAAGMLLGGFLLRSGADRACTQGRAFRSPGTDKLNMLLRLIDAQYVDTVRMDSLTEEIIPLILENLDPHSMYFSAKDLAQANETIEGEFDGIGVVFNMATDTVVVLNVIAGGPSAKAGIQGEETWDRDGRGQHDVAEESRMDQNEVVERLEGSSKGGEVRLGIARFRNRRADPGHRPARRHSNQEHHGFVPDRPGYRLYQVRSTARSTPTKN